jgi:hypothetical protein
MVSEKEDSLTQAGFACLSPKDQIITIIGKTALFKP